jgi:glycerophosphoryl diester phosphodiesterase
MLGLVAGGIVKIGGLVVLYYAAQALLRARHAGRPVIWAHRGAPKSVPGKPLPENTLAAFRQAAALGADGIEMDVQRTKDGALIVIHDETVDRTTSGRGRVADLTLAEIRALDAGGGEKVPTFDEVIAFAKEAGTTLVVELKSAHHYPGIEKEALRAIEAAGMLDRTVLLGFSAASLEKLRALAPRGQLCSLSGLWKWTLPPIPARAQVASPMAEMVVLNPYILRQARRQGLPAYVWFGIIERPFTLRFLKFFGADGVIVDDLRPAMTIFKRKAPPPPPAS